MNRSELKAILQNAYDRNLWISTLQFLTGKREFLTINLSPKTIEVNTQQAERLIKTFNQIGSVKTSDGITLPIFEVILENNIRIEHNRVAVNEFIKKHIIRDAIKGALVTFSYDEGHHKTEWRFSFISKNAANDFFAEAEAEETNPKKYTYIFGNKEEHRTAIERLYNLEQSRFRLEDFFEAFNVEPVSKKFFEEYKHLYKELSDYIINEKQYFDLFKSDTDVSPEKEVRNFVSRLLGRIVFLYFLQKKNWLGATSIEYKDGSTSFLSDLFFSDEKNQDDFYSKYLCPIFFEALNTADRKNDEFKLENGKILCIPFLNGGLFEEEQEPNGHRDIKIPTFHFKMLFDFFNGFNFTVYENSPEEHTVAVDPEMLGHIFENLIDYNKDTGTFYTPKEIVQYMTQESLIEYLNTHLQKDRPYIVSLVKNQSTNHFEDEELKKINQLLDDVKICDPAIGSGAFPMGMLQEIFNLKALINFKLGFEVWSPATVKQNIIQNSIYGVDLDEGAVEIARLRFWLSLVVDEGKPKALPNLLYKILVGNSLLDKFEGNPIEIDWSLDSTTGGLFLQDTIEEKINLLKKLSEKQNKYFFATSKEKSVLYNEIEYLKLEILSKELKVMIDSKGTNFFSSAKNSKKQNEIYEQTLKWKKALEKINQLKSNKDAKFSHFDWTLDFPEILNPIIIDEKKRGFDIVIGNPPYVDIKALNNDFVKQLFNKYESAMNRINLYSIFIEKGKNLLNEKGVLSFIIPNSLLVNDSYQKIRKQIIADLLQVIKLPDSIFQNAIVETIIFLLRKNSNSKEVMSLYFKNDEKTTLENLKFRKQNKVEWQKDPLCKFNIFQNSLEAVILKLIESDSETLDKSVKFSLGITPYDKAKGHSQSDIKNRVFHSDKKESDEYVPLINGKNIKRFEIDLKFDEYLKYGNWLGAPRDERFFKSPKIIVRQILDGSNLRIIAGYSEEKVYFTQIGFSLISPDENTKNLKYILSILNSKLMSFYHKYKFLDIEKIVFPKILIANAKKFPIKKIDTNIQLYLEFLVDINIYLKKSVEKIDKYSSNYQLSNFFEEVIDGLIFDLYFEEEMKYKEIYITDEVKASLQEHNIGNNFENLDEVIKKEIIISLYNTWSKGSIQIKIADYVVKSPTILKPILQS